MSSGNYHSSDEASLVERVNWGRWFRLAVVIGLGAMIIGTLMVPIIFK